MMCSAPNQSDKSTVLQTSPFFLVLGEFSIHESFYLPVVSQKLLRQAALAKMETQKWVLVGTGLGIDVSFQDYLCILK